MSLRFEGYAAVWDRADRAGDVFRAGAFGPRRLVPLLWQHRGAAVGEAAVSEDARGLKVEAVVLDPRAAGAVRAGAVAGLSVGYRPLEARQGARRELRRVALAEVSLVAVPMQPLARIETIFNEGNGE
jgi:hypothetical protein